MQHRQPLMERVLWKALEHPKYSQLSSRWQIGLTNSAAAWISCFSKKSFTWCYQNWWILPCKVLTKVQIYKQNWFWKYLKFGHVLSNIFVSPSQTQACLLEMSHSWGQTGKELRILLLRTIHTNSSVRAGAKEPQGGPFWPEAIKRATFLLIHSRGRKP